MVSYLDEHVAQDIPVEFRGQKRLLHVEGKRQEVEHIVRWLPKVLGAGVDPVEIERWANSYDRMQAIDSLPKPIRDLVNGFNDPDYGKPIQKARRRWR